MHAMHDLAPHAARLQHVALIHARHFTATLAGRFERLTGNALHLELAVLHHIDHTLARSAISARAVLVVETIVLAKVNVAGKLVAWSRRIGRIPLRATD